MCVQFYLHVKLRLAVRHRLLLHKQFHGKCDSCCLRIYTCCDIFWPVSRYVYVYEIYITIYFQNGFKRESFLFLRIWDNVNFAVQLFRFPELKCVSLILLIRLINIIHNKTLIQRYFPFNRYVAIVRPLHRRNSRKKAIIFLLLIWMFSGALSMPCLLYSTTESKMWVYNLVYYVLELHILHVSFWCISRNAKK